MRYINYDIVFVLPPPTVSYPPGGYDIVYRLAQALNKENIRTSIIFLVVYVIMCKYKLSCYQ